MRIYYNLYITHAHHVHIFSLMHCLTWPTPHIHIHIHMHACIQGHKGMNNQMSLFCSLNYSSMLQKLYLLCSLLGWLR